MGLRLTAIFRDDGPSRSTFDRAARSDDAVTVDLAAAVRIDAAALAEATHRGVLVSARGEHR